MGYTALKELTLAQQHAKIKIRVSRIWESTTPQFKKDILSLDCLLIDEEGYAMQATIRKYDAETFRSLLCEGNAYIIENFNVIPSRSAYKVVDRKYAIQISKWTRVVEAKEDVAAIPFFSFYFLSFDYIKNRKHPDGCLIDVLGNIVAAGPVSYTYVAQERTAIRKLQIGNLVNETLSVTLWDKFAIEFDDRHILQEDTNAPIIVVFSGMNIRTYREQLYVSTCSASKIYTNLEIQEVIDFRSDLCRRQTPAGPIQHMESVTEPILSPYEQMSKNRKTISELLGLNSDELKDSKYTCEAKLMAIDTNYGWWYKACYDCKGAVKDYSDSFWCTQCGKNDQPPVPWYKLNSVVEDGTGSADFTIFGKSAQDLIHVSAHHLAAANNSDRFVLPAAIKNILGRSYIFQISADSRRLNIGPQSFRVTKIFASNSDTKGKGKQLSKNTKSTEEGTAKIVIPVEYHDDVLDEISPDSAAQSLTSQSTSEILQPKSRKRRYSCIEDSASDKEDE